MHKHHRIVTTDANHVQTGICFWVRCPTRVVTYPPVDTWSWKWGSATLKGKRKAKRVQQ